MLRREREITAEGVKALGTFIVSCVTKRDSSDIYPCIQGIGGLRTDTGRRWYLSEEEAIACVEDGIHEFVIVIGGRNAKLVVGSGPGGDLYLKTSADGHGENNLLLRPQCPVLEVRSDAA